MNETAYTHFADLLTALPAISADTIISRTLLNTPHLKAVLFGFAPGQALSEHTSARPAILHFLDGNAAVTLGSDTFEVAPGAWFHLPPQMPHSIVAQTPVTMLLLLL